MSITRVVVSSTPQANGDSNGIYRVFMISPEWSPTISDTLLNAARLLNPSIIVTHP
jgi:hypothetical protein